MGVSSQSARQQWILIAILVVVIVAGGVTGFVILNRKPAAPVVKATFTPKTDAMLRSLLDQGKYDQLLAETDRLCGELGQHATVLRYRSLALLVQEKYPAAEKAADGCLRAGAAGPEAAIANAVKAFAALHDPAAAPASAKEAAEQAIVQAGSDAQASLLANVALAAVLRGEAGRTDGKSAVADQVSRLCQTLEPLYAFHGVELRQPWLVKFWRLGLAMYGEGAIFAARAHDIFTEAQVLTIFQRSCPPDVWTCSLGIPLRAKTAARQPVAAGKVSDHARAAFYTAVGVLYESAGDLEHADVVYGSAMQAFQQALDTTDEWAGPRTQIANGSETRIVGADYFTYRDCLYRIAVHRANQWSQWIAAGTAGTTKALAACDNPIFRSLVRLRADKQAAPGTILRSERVNPHYWPLLADLLQHYPSGLSPADAEYRAEAVRIAAKTPDEALVADAGNAMPTAADSSAARKPAQRQPYAQMADVALGVGGGHALSRSAAPSRSATMAKPAAEPLPDFGLDRYPRRALDFSRAGRLQPSHP